MPWPGVSPVELRRAFVAAYASGRCTMTALCEQFGISRRVGYKWVDRADAGAGELADRSRRPHTSPTAIAPEVVEALCACRRQHPTWSARKLLAVLREADPARAWPARSTAAALLKRHGLVRSRRRRDRHHAVTSALAAITRANEVWTTDFKGEFRTGDGVYCYPLTLRDGYSRYVLGCEALTTKRSETVRRRFERAFRTYGLPERIRSDNGGPFAATGLTRLSYLSVWWIRLGIRPERIALGHPEQNGSHEQFHRVLKAETTRPPAASARAQQRRFRRFCAEYNTVRPHEALRDTPPHRHYTASTRAFPTRLPALEYPGHMEVRRVMPSGHASWRGRGLYLTEVLAGHPVAFEEVEDGIWLLYFGGIRLARFDERTRRLTAVPHA